MTVAGGGAVEHFIGEFNAFEAGERLFERCTDEDGFAWWDLVRYAVQFAICAEKGIYAHQPAEPSSRSRKAVRLAGRGLFLLRDALRVVSCRGARLQHAYVFKRRTAQLLDDIETGGVACLLVNDNGTGAAPHVAIRKASLDLFVRVASKIVHAPDDVAAEAARIGTALRARFVVRTDLRQVILRKYREHRAARLAWSFLLSRLPGLDLIGFIGDDSQKTLVSLAKERGIRTREYQHGYMGRSHINYSYPALTVRPSTLPCEVLVHRDSGDIEYPVQIVHAGPTRALEAAPSDGPRDIDVLVGGSPTRVTETVAIVEALTGKGLSVAVKLHPNQTPSSSGLQHFTRQQVRLYSNELDFIALARRSRVYVPANPSSTTVFEAVENGASLIVVDYGGTKVTSMHDGIVSERVDSIDSLHRVVLLHLDRPDQRTAVP